MRSFTEDLAQRSLQAIVAKDGQTALSLLTELLASAATGGASDAPEAPPSDAPPAPTAARKRTKPQTFIVEGKQVELDGRELAIAAEAKCEPKVYATLKGRRTPKAAYRWRAPKKGSAT